MISITPIFLESYSKLSKNDQKKIFQTIQKLLRDKNSKGFRKHKLSNEFYSISAGMDLRIIFLPIKKRIVLNYVDHHDDAYSWANNHSAILDETGNFLEILPVYTKEKEVSQYTGEVSLNYGEQIVSKLRNLKLPTSILEKIRRVQSEDQLLFLLENVSPILQETVLSAATEIPIAGEKIDQQMFSRIAVVNDDEDLKNALSYPLDHWRIFLHPIQKNVVSKDKFKKVVIVGGPGTGKTICLLHRAIQLDADNLNVLLVTRTKNLSKLIIKEITKLKPNNHNIIIGYFVEESISLSGSDIFIYKNYASISKGKLLLNAPLRFYSSQPIFKNLLRIDHILIDEVQDMNPEQQKWLTELSDYVDLGITLSIDNNQAVYSSRIVNLVETLNNDVFEKVYLNYSYRLTKEIINSARTVNNKIQELYQGAFNDNISDFDEFNGPQTKYKVKRSKRLESLKLFSKFPTFYGLTGSTVEIKSTSYSKLKYELFDIVETLKNYYAEDQIAVLSAGNTKFVRKLNLGVESLDFSDAKGREWFAGIVIIGNKFVDYLYSNKLQLRPVDIMKINKYYVALTRFREFLVVIEVSDTHYFMNNVSKDGLYEFASKQTKG
jgi:mRNA-degrading endonuclease RelE of RelBE toxin-antitoxin system